MSSHPLQLKGSRLLLVALLAIAAILAISALAAAQHPDDQDANQGGSGLSEYTGDWVVGSGDDLTYANQTISLDGTLSISGGGKLALRNVTLVLHGDLYDAQEITVFDGELTITDWDGDPATEGDRSVVKADDPEFNYYFQVYEEATFTLTNSWVRDCGRLFNLLGIHAGLYIASADVTIADSDITLGYGGLFVDGVAITVERLDIEENEWIGVYADHGASPTLVDCQLWDNDREGMMVKDHSHAVVRDCSIRGNLRGVVVDGATMTAHGTAISGNTEVDIDLPYFSNLEMFNCTVSTSSTIPPIRMENSSLTSTHGNFDIAKVDMTASIFRYQQFLVVKVVWGDSLQTPIPDVPVDIEDVEANMYSFSTGPDGMTGHLPLLVVVYDKTGPILKTTNNNPFHVTVTHNAQEKDTYADLRYDNAVVTFQYADTQPPDAVAPTMAEVNVGVGVVLDGSASTDNVAIATWNWSFDELGQTVYLDGERVTYAFKQAKTYSVTLKVVDTSGNTDTGSIVKFDVTARDRTPPAADAGADQTLEQGSVVTLDGSNSTDNVGIVEYTWSFTYQGAPRSLTGRVVTWKFDVPGVYLVVLFVEDAAGLSDTDETTITVTDTTAPVTLVSYNPEMPTERKYDEIVQIIFNVDDSGSPTADLNYRINGGTWEKVVGSLALDFGGDLQYGDGRYTIEFYSEDPAGNTEEVRTITEFLVDATSPTFTDMQPPVSPYTVTTETYTISGRTEPGVTLTINAVVATVAADGSFSQEITLVNGDNPVHLNAVDQVGHTADLTLVITKTKYEPGNGGGEDGGGVLLYAAVGAAVLVIVVLLVFFLVIQKRGGEGMGPDD